MTDDGWVEYQPRWPGAEPGGSDDELSTEIKARFRRTLYAVGGVVLAMLFLAVVMSSV